MQNKNTILWHFGGHFCGVLTRNFVAFWRTLLRCFDTQFCGILADTFAVRACGDDGWENLVRRGLRW